MKKFALAALISSTSLLAHPLQAQDKKSENQQTNSKPVTKHASVTINDQVINYTVTTSELTLKDDQNKEQASIFNVAYVKKDTSDPSTRPVTFAFNGGPGSSAVWLHLGALGPKIIPTSPDGTTALTPPIKVQDNPFSILDKTDLVFIDPVSTGLSRSNDPKKASAFHGLRGDVDSVGDFIRRWITENQRWSSPKYLIGESYGAIRAASLSSHLQKRYGMDLNGVVLLSGLLDFRTLSSAQGDDLTYLTYLTSLTATAHHHGVIEGDLDQLLSEAKKFASSTYLTALHKGNSLPEEEKDAIAAQLSKFTGLSKEWIHKQNIRISPSLFRKELLASKGKVVGRFDARVSWDAMSTSSPYPAYDPSFSVAKGPFSTAMLDYLSRDLGWKDDRVYEILTGKVHPWNWSATNKIVNVSTSIEKAFTQNPNLRYLVLCGKTDLATPSGAILHSLDHLELTQEQRSRIDIQWYDAGHMFYLNQPDLEKLHKDLSTFYTPAK